MGKVRTALTGIRKHLWRHKGKYAVGGGGLTAMGGSWHHGFATHSRIVNYDPLKEHNRKMWVRQNKQINKKLNRLIKKRGV